MHVPHRSSADLTGGAGRVETVSRLQGLASVAFLANALDVQDLPALLPLPPKMRGLLRAWSNQ